MPAILLVYKSVCVGLCSMPTASPCFLVICSLSDNCAFVLSHVNPAVALLRVLTPRSLSREALKDRVVECKCPLVLPFLNRSFLQNVRLRTALSILDYFHLLSNRSQAQNQVWGREMWLLQSGSEMCRNEYFKTRLQSALSKYNKMGG